LSKPFRARFGIEERLDHGVRVIKEASFSPRTS
jgi:hypothetical protein